MRCGLLRCGLLRCGVLRCGVLRRGGRAWERAPRARVSAYSCDSTTWRSLTTSSPRPRAGAPPGMLMDAPRRRWPTVDFGDVRARGGQGRGRAAWCTGLGARRQPRAGACVWWNETGCRADAGPEHWPEGACPTRRGRMVAYRLRGGRLRERRGPGGRRREEASLAARRPSTARGRCAGGRSSGERAWRTCVREATGGGGQNGRLLWWLAIGSQESGAQLQAALHRAAWPPARLGATPRRGRAARARRPAPPAPR